MPNPFKNLLGHGKPSAPAPAVAASAPPPPPHVALRSGEVLRRDAVLDAKLRVIGYELRLCASSDCPAALATLLSHVDITPMLARRFAFVNLCGRCFDAADTTSLPAGQVAIGIPANVDISPDDRLARVRSYKTQGLAVFLDGAAGADPTLLDLVDYVRLDLAAGLAPHQALLPQLKTHRVLSIARNVNTLEDFEAARAAGFTYFQGPGWQCPRPDHAAKNVLRSHVLELINLTKVQADVSDLEGVLLRDPLLSYQLLRLVNSAGSGLVQPVRSMAQALMVLGYQPLYRWLVTLLYTAGDHDERAEALLHTALTRARLMESLGGEQLGRAHRDGLYLTGMFSLLDVLLGKPMVEALAGLSLTRPLLEALLDRHGTYAPWLELALALENPAEAPVTEAANRLELSAENLNAAHIDALIWADQVAD